MTDTATTAPSPLRPESLLSRAGRRRTSAGLRARAAEAFLRRLLDQLYADELIVITPAGLLSSHGPGPDEAGSLSATIQVLDERAWTAVATEGSRGLGRGYIEGWWTSPDPTAVVRVLIRNLRPIDELRNRLDGVAGRAGDTIRRLLPRPGREQSREDIASHYDLGNDFFRLFLDDTMTYSAAVFRRPDTDLAAASNEKYDRLLAKLGVTADHHVLEIGTGWGGFAIRAASETGCRVTTTTISAEQRREATERIRTAGLDRRVEVLDADWRDLGGTFDRVVSIEMIEAVDWRHYDDFFATVERRLRPDGLAGIQAICVPDRRYERTKNTEDFIRRFVFPGGHLPSFGAIARSTARATSMHLLDLEDITVHYGETLRRWRSRFDANLDALRQLGLDDRFVRLWRFYLSYCEAGFLERHCSANQFVLAGADWRPDSVGLRPV